MEIFKKIKQRKLNKKLALELAKENILYKKEIRNPKSLYYEKDSLSLKEKMYSFLYRLYTSNITNGERWWYDKLEITYGSSYVKYYRSFDKDYIEFSDNPITY